MLLGCKTGKAYVGLWVIKVKGFCERSPKLSLRNDIRVAFGAPLLLGKWNGIAAYFLYKK